MPREQDQFLDVVDRDEAERRWRRVIADRRPRTETIALSEALGRVLAESVAATVDVPAFDRANVDGFALRADETFDADELRPIQFQLIGDEIGAGAVPRVEVVARTATPIATGGMLPRGADATVMVEQTRLDGDGGLLVTRPLAPGANITFAGTDIARGERVLGRGTRLTARDTGVLAAIGQANVLVVRPPRVGVLSTGDEIVEPGIAPLPPAAVYDSNATMLAHAVIENGGLPIPLGVVRDDPAALDDAIDHALAECDLILLTGGTSKGAGDLSHRLLARRSPGIAVHGVALKPGKPLCLGAIGPIPIAILPGFPTSALFTFHEFVAPLIREWAGLRSEAIESINASLSMRVNSDPGRTEFVLVRLIDGPRGKAAYPMGQGSGSVSAFCRADGFITIGKHIEYVEAGERVNVRPLGRGLASADLVVIGSHCTGLDILLDTLAAQGFTAKTLWVGSQGGLVAAGRGESDVAGVHLLEPGTGRYNEPFLPPGVRLLRGYERMQCVVFRSGDDRFESRTAREAVATALADPSCRMVNRNRGSGTRVLIDELLAGRRPPGFAVEARSHNAVAAAVVQGRADWGLAIQPVAASYGLGFHTLRPECYDFAVPESRWDHPAVAAFRATLERPDVRSRLAAIGFTQGGSAR